LIADAVVAETAFTTDDTDIANGTAPLDIADSSDAAPFILHASNAAVASADDVTAGKHRRRLQQTTRVQQDLLLLYTPAAATAAGGDEAIINQARISVAMTNKAYVDSNVNVQINVLDIRRVQYTETADVWGDLVNGRIPNVNTWRDQVSPTST
jgi:hypothetical protein